MDASFAAKVKQCILVSADKAVKPANVMGATKRVAEMIIAAARVALMELAWGKTFPRFELQVKASARNEKGSIE